MHNIPMLAPNWLQIGLGPLLRREKDLRLYFDLFDKRKEDVSGLKGMWLDLVLNKFPEPDSLATTPQELSPKSCEFVFEGLKDSFTPLNGWNDFLLQRLRSITKKKWLQKVDEHPVIPIGMHLRRGDYPEDKWIPVSWYKYYLKFIRNVIGKCVPAYLFSDGNYNQLKELIKCPDVIWVNDGNAITDLLLLAKSKVLLSSPSTFSSWASFFGSIPTLCYPGHNLSWYGVKPQKDLFLDVCPEDSPPENLKEHILKQFIS